MVRSTLTSIAGAYEKRDNGVLWSPYAYGLRFEQARPGDRSQRWPLCTDLWLVHNNLRCKGGWRASGNCPSHRLWRCGARARLEFRHEFRANRDSSVAYADLPGTPRYALVSAQTLRNAIVASVGSDFQFKRGLTVGIDYQVTHVFQGQQRGPAPDGHAAARRQGQPVVLYLVPDHTFEAEGLPNGRRFHVRQQRDPRQGRAEQAVRSRLLGERQQNELFTFEDRENIIAPP